MLSSLNCLLYVHKPIVGNNQFCALNTSIWHTLRSRTTRNIMRFVTTSIGWYQYGRLIGSWLTEVIQKTYWSLRSQALLTRFTFGRVFIVYVLIIESKFLSRNSTRIVETGAHAIHRVQIRGEDHPTSPGPLVEEGNSSVLRRWKRTESDRGLNYY